MKHDRAARWRGARALAHHLLRDRIERQPGHDVSDEPRDESGQWTAGGGDGGGTGGYVSTPASADKKPGDVARVHRLDATNRAAFKATEITPLTFHELKADGAQRFHDAIAKAAAASPYGAAVAVHSPKEYAGMRTFLTPDEKVGVALQGDNIVSLFKHPESTARSAAASALTLATQQGGRRLDAFDTVLPRLYSEGGFRAVARLPFNEKFAPPGWDKEKFAAYNGGKPDIVFMAYDPQHPHAYAAGEGKTVSTYEEGEKAQQEFLQSLDAAHAAAEPKPATSPTTAMTQLELWPGQFPDIPPPKKDLALDDFKGKVTVAPLDPAKAKKFLDTWNTHVHEAPEEFREEFTGGLPGTMRIEYDQSEHHGHEYTNEMRMSGTIEDAQGNKIGSYDRTIDFLNNKASSDYFVLNRGMRGKDIGKQMLAANVAMYQKLGLDSVDVHANIDVGGYAWAKYGYVPDDFDALAEELRSRSGAGSGYPPEDWDSVSSDQQEQIFEAWKRDTRDDFEQSEIESWRENGGDLQKAKEDLTSELQNAKTPPAWLADALADAPIPAQQIFDGLTVGDYSSRYDDGKADPDITVADAEGLSEDQRSDIESKIVSAFNDQADSDRGDVDPPDWISDNIESSQSDIWDSMRDRDKYRWASDNDKLTPEESGDVDPELSDLINSGDPKAIWAISDRSDGKDLLLGTDWNGSLDLNDPESMERFDAYVSKAKK